MLSDLRRRRPRDPLKEVAAGAILRLLWVCAVAVWGWQGRLIPAVAAIITLGAAFAALTLWQQGPRSRVN
jgi:hypothetical protein